MMHELCTTQTVEKGNVITLSAGIPTGRNRGTSSQDWGLRIPMSCLQADKPSEEHPYKMSPVCP